MNETHRHLYANGVLLILKFLFVSLAGYKGETIHCLKTPPSKDRDEMMIVVSEE